MPERKRYTKEFKLDAVSLVLDQGHSRIDVAKMLDVNNQITAAGLKNTSKTTMAKHLEVMAS